MIFSLIRGMEVRGIKNQFASSVIVNILSLGIGGLMVWTSPYLALLKSPETPLSTQISSNDASTLGGLVPLGALIGALTFGWFAEKIGRLWSLRLNAIPQIIWWLTTIFTTELYILYIGRFFAGIAAGGCYTLIPLYIAEISQDEIRGSLSSLFMLSLNFGMLMMYLAGDFVDYKIVQMFFLCLNLIFMICSIFLKDTPIYLLKNGKKEEAEKSLKFLRGFTKDQIVDVLFQNEMQKMKLKIEENEKSKKSIKNLLNPLSMKAVIFGIILIGLNQFSGTLTFAVYAADIFRDSGSSLSPNQSAIIIGIHLMAGSIISFFIMDRFNRKTLFFWTNLGNILGLLMMGYYKAFDVKFDIIPIISLSTIILFFSIARLPLTYIITAEIQPQNSRSFGIAISSSVSWIFGFIMLKYYADLVELINFANTMFLFAGILLVSQVFVRFMIPETKNKSFEEIEEALR